MVPAKAPYGTPFNSTGDRHQDFPPSDKQQLRPSTPAQNIKNSTSCFLSPFWNNHFWSPCNLLSEMAFCLQQFSGNSWCACTPTTKISSSIPKVLVWIPMACKLPLQGTLCAERGYLHAEHGYFWYRVSSQHRERTLRGRAFPVCLSEPLQALYPASVNLRR